MIVTLIPQGRSHFDANAQKTKQARESRPISRREQSAGNRRRSRKERDLRRAVLSRRRSAEHVRSEAEYVRNLGRAPGELEGTESPRNETDHQRLRMRTRVVSLA